MQWHAFPLTQGVEPKAAMVAQHRVAFLLHDGPGPVAQMLADELVEPDVAQEAEALGLASRRVRQLQLCRQLAHLVCMGGRVAEWDGPLTGAGAAGCGG